MLFGVETKPDNAWWIGSKVPDLGNLSKYESLMYQGNGYLGIRGSLEEHYLGEKRDMFVIGTFDKFRKEATELPNLPDLVNLEIRINDQKFSLNDGEILDYQRGLNLKNGEMKRSFIWKINNDEIKFQFQRFVSMDNLHLFVSKVQVTPLTSNARIQIRSGIDGQQTNSGSQHLTEGNKRLFNARFIQMQGRTQKSKIKFALTEYHRIFLNDDELALGPHLKINRRQVYADYAIGVGANETLTFLKYSNVFSSIDKDLKRSVAKDGLANLKKVSKADYQALLNASTKVWNEKIWQHSLVKITAADNKPQVAVNFARYQLIANTPQDFGMNIGAKGMTGEGYKGHTFWDTEIFMLPFFNLSLPSYARNLMKYRYLGLFGAIRKAHENGFQGAQYPWESANPTDGESTPKWANADIVTGKPMKILSAPLEQHITSDVAYGMMQYLLASNDTKFAKKMGYEVILECAKFWASRLEWNSRKNRYEINNVIGPDEYKEHANNDAYTNYMAHWNMKKAAEIITDLKTNDRATYERLDRRINLKQLLKALIQKASTLYLPQPNAEKVIPQDDKYLTYPKLDVSRYQAAEKGVEDVSEIFKDYDLKEIDKMQVTKQADVILMLVLFENQFSKDIIQKNWDYYEPITTHDSSLSYSPHAIIANDLGLNKKAYHYFEKSCEVDLGANMGSSSKGDHMAAMGGIWNVVVQGFGGARITESGLQIQPHIPEQWDSLEYQIMWHGVHVDVVVKPENFVVKVDQKLTFNYRGQKYEATPGDELMIKF